eukprot:m.74610 g.74610  ORF g.74610 m.74610 type:complete len:69 (+) comp11813_c0_seq2:1640-1846(+)
MCLKFNANNVYSQLVDIYSNTTLTLYIRYPSSTFSILLCCTYKIKVMLINQLNNILFVFAITFFRKTS